MRAVLLTILLSLSLPGFGQTFMVKGELLGEDATPLSSAAAVLLDPSDSTLLYFSVTGQNGRFLMTNVKRGEYLLQISLIGYNTFYRNVILPGPSGGDQGVVVMAPKVYDVEGVVVSRERIPLKLKADTIEYDARAFRVNPDAVAEELLKKLPGLEVDRAGNIKAMGEDVRNVLVDGKEFFGNDPKVATKNLPADAIDKVQLFDKQSDESVFSGIDDGERNPTLNFVLGEDKKKGIFGDVTAGAGTEGHIKASGKAYRFTDKTQFAALGMFNNVNDYGFSVGDYITFSGGLKSVTLGGGHAAPAGSTSFPVNFGQPVYGTGSNGAAGLNFSVSNANKDRFFISYLGSGTKRNLSDLTTTVNYLPEGDFRIEEDARQVRKDTAHKVSFGLRKMIRGKQNIIINGTVDGNTAANPLGSSSESYLGDVLVNALERSNDEMAMTLSGSADASYLVKISEGRSILKVTGKASYTDSESETLFSNRTEYFNPYSIIESNQFYNLNSLNQTYSAGINFTHKVSRFSYMDLSFNAGYSYEEIERRQGDFSMDMLPVEELSPDFNRQERFIRPGLTWKRSTSKSQLSLTLLASTGIYGTTLNGEEGDDAKYSFLTPRASWEYEYRSGRRLTFSYISSVNTPRAAQLLPVVNNLNALSLFYGNRDLRPEYIHSARALWWLFDQFSFTTLLTGVNASYTRDKIGYARIVKSDLGQEVTLVNTDNDWAAGADVDFATVIRPLRIRVNLSLAEEFRRGTGFVNGEENTMTGMNHKISLTFENRKKEKWDIETGSTLNLSTSRYSLQNSLNNSYSDISWFATATFSPGDRLSFNASADITNYAAGSFNEQRLVPLLGAGVNYYFMKNRRATLSLAGVDLLDRNRGIIRESDLNYLMEKRSSIIGRYLLLSFKYRLNKAADMNGGVNITVKNR
ncbi:MAG: outer membrane beta-barrel protein [Bacteroidales bacterium]|nr:outer membrane beta-barrel protein [Bacteroidales bacterium]